MTVQSAIEAELPYLCAGPDCARPVGPRSRTGLCRSHRAQLQRGADELTPIQRWSRSANFPTLCTVPGCDRPHGGKGMCKAHRQRVLRGLDASEPIKPHVRRWGCLVVDCVEKHFAGAYCKRHYGALVTRFNAYGITREHADRLLHEQGNRCTLCRQTLSLAEAVIDHDHNCCPRGGSCGDCVRGMLCGLCNLGLGAFRDNAEAMSRAIEYLRGAR